MQNYISLTKKDKSVLTHQDYVSTINKFLNVEDFLWDTDIDKPISKISSLFDLITGKEIGIPTIFWTIY